MFFLNFRHKLFGTLFCDILSLSRLKKLLYPYRPLRRMCLLSLLMIVTGIVTEKAVQIAVSAIERLSGFNIFKFY